MMRTSPLLSGAIMMGGGGDSNSNYASPAVVRILETSQHQGGETGEEVTLGVPPSRNRNHHHHPSASSTASTPRKNHHKSTATAADPSILTRKNPPKGIAGSNISSNSGNNNHKRFPRMFSRRHLHHLNHPHHFRSEHSDSMSVSSEFATSSSLVSAACVSVPARLGQEDHWAPSPSLGQEWYSPDTNHINTTTRASSASLPPPTQQYPPSPFSANASVCNYTIASNDTVKISNKSILLLSSLGSSCRWGVGGGTGGNISKEDAAKTETANSNTLKATASNSGTLNGGGSGSSPAKILKRFHRLRTGLFSHHNHKGEEHQHHDAHHSRLYSLSEDCCNARQDKRGSSRSLTGSGSNALADSARVRCSSEDASSGYFSTLNSKGGGRFKSNKNKKKGRGQTSNDDVTCSPAKIAAARQARLDQSIRGRFDGLDVLSLGPAYLSSTTSISSSALGRSSSTGSGRSNIDNEEDSGDCRHRPERILPWEALPPYTFTGKSLYLTPADMVSRMLWTCSQNSSSSTPEVILEGFIPGEDRWSVRIEQTPSSSPVSAPSVATPTTTTAPTTSPKTVVAASSSSTTTASSSWLWKQQSLEHSNTHHEGPPTITPVLTEEETSDDGGSPIVPTYQLWPTLWGTSDKAPERADLDQIAEEDPLLHLAAEHSIPIDLDENTFCVSEKCHLEIIHNFVQTSLSVGRFDTAVMIVSKLVKGMDLKVQEENLRFLKGAALHNLGVLYMWQGKYEAALEQFHLAVQERSRSLPKDHGDISVSTMWKGLAQFALGRLDDALFCLELVLDSMDASSSSSYALSNPGEMARSKVLNNMGVVYYQKKEYMLALKQFTASLEIQRGWLDGAVRRDCNVYNASTTLSNMGKLYLERGDVDLAYFVYEEALLLQTTIFRKDHDLVLESLKSLALTRARDSQVKKALQILQGCLRSQSTRFGKDSTETIDTLGYMGYLYENLECHEDALKCLATVKKWQKLNLPSNHPALRKTKETVNRLEEAIGKKVSVWV